MAIDLSPLLTDHNARPYHLQVLADMFNGQSEDTMIALDQSAIITTAKANIYDLADAQASDLAADLVTMRSHVDDAVDATSLSSIDKTNLKMQIAAVFAGEVSAPVYFNALKSNIESEIDNDFTPEITVNKSDVLEAIKAELDALIVGDSTHFPYQDIWCQGTGRYERRRDAGIDPSDYSLKHCDVCDGFGRKAAQDEIIIIKPPVTVYP